MEENKKYIRKSFWVHQYEKEETFLSKMANEGWHFVKLHKGIPTKYEFVKGEKVDYIYQLDYVTQEEDTEDYHQLFTDAGWNEVYSWDGVGGKWYYFHRVHSNGQKERIFTDSESKYQMYEKLWKKFGLLFIFLLFMELNGIWGCISILNRSGLTSLAGTIILISCVIFALITGLLVYWIIGILIEKNKIKNRLTGKF